MASPQEAMKYLSLFSGIGGFELGIQQAYEDKRVKKQDSISQGRQKKIRNTRDGHNETRGDMRYSGQSSQECIGYSEIDKYAIQIYEKHFNHKNYGDITKIDERGLPDFELLCGGFPCQSFSIAGKREGFEDTRGTLFFDIARIAKHKRPRLLLLENVKGLLSHDKGRTFNTIIVTLTELGYDLQWQVLNSKNFGVPQNRERVFIVGHLRGTSRPEVFPFGENNSENDSVQPKKNKQGAWIPSLNTRYGQRWSGEGYIGIRQLNQPKHSNDRIYGKEGVSPTLNTAQGGRRQPKIVASRGRNPTNPSDRTVGAPTEQRLEVNEQGTSNTLTNVQKDNLVLENSSIRRLTPTECERLQGFPDGWTEGVSDTQRYKTLGNAVTVNVVKAIAEKLGADGLGD